MGVEIDGVVYDDDDWMESDEKTKDGNQVQTRSRDPIAFCVLAIQAAVYNVYQFLNKLTRGHLVGLICLVAFVVYFILAMNYEFGEESSIRLFVCTMVGVLILTRGHVYHIGQRAFVAINGSAQFTPRSKFVIKKIRLAIKWALYIGLAALMIYVIIDEGRRKPKNLRSVPGLAAFLLVCLLVSRSPRNINWHTVYWSVGLQFLCALFVLKWSKGKEAILWVQDRFDEFFANARQGSQMVFGDTYAEHYLVFAVFPIFFLSNATLVVLYYVGAMQFIIRVIGTFLNFVLGCSPVESMSVAASIFMEGIVSVLSLRPYLGSLSRSQLFLVITSVFSSLGGGYLAVLSQLHVPLSFVIPAMLVSAPATFAVCKLMIPETRKKRKGEKFDWDYAANVEKSKYTNVLDAAQDGAVSILHLVANALVITYVFFSYISWINKTLGWFGDRVGIDDLSIERISSYLLFPVALAMGIEWDDCSRVAMLLGYRIGTNNIVSFLKLTEWKMQKAQYYQYMMATNFTGPVSTDGDDIILDGWNTTLKYGFLSDRSEAIATYSLCGFSSFLTLSVIVGIMYVLLPRRRKWLGSVGGAAIIAGNIANCMTGCFASLFY